MLDIIIPTHNKVQLTIQCLEALYKNTPEPFRLIIVDDSTDFTPDYLRLQNIEHGNITLIHSDKPYKTGNQTLNIGLAEVKTDVAVFMANSTFVEPDWTLYPPSIMNESPKVGIIGAKLLYQSGIIEHCGIVFADSAPGVLMDIGRGEPGHRHSMVMEVPAVGFALVFLRMEAMPLFDETTYIGWGGYEDIDACMQVKENGWQILCCGMCSAYHTAAATRLKDKATFDKNMLENRRRFVKRWQPDKYDASKEKRIEQVLIAGGVP